MMNIGRLRQFHAAFASGFGTFLMSVVTVWPSYTSELYMSNTTTPLSAPMTRMEEALLGSLPALGAVAGTVTAGPIVDMFGRKNGGLLLTLPYVLSWAVIAVSSSIKVILAARFLAGLSGGGTLVLVPILVSEVSEDSIRGFLASIPTLQACLGNLLSYMIGWFLPHKMVLWVNVVFAVAGSLLFLLVEESPVFLLKKRRDEDAKKAIARYRGLPTSSRIVQEELFRLKQLVSPGVQYESILESGTKAQEAEKNEKINHQDILPQKQTSSYKTLFLSPASRRAFILVTTLITLQVFMGMVPVQVYLSTVFTETDPTRADMFTVIFASLQCFASLVIVIAADRTGRRFLQITSSALICLCLTALGFLLQTRVAPSWVTVVVIMLYCFLFVVGAGSIPYVLLAEMFVPEVMNLATTLIIEWMWFTNFVIITIFPYMIEFFGIYGTFYGFAAVSLVNALTSYFILPETAGLSIEQIQEKLLPRRKREEKAREQT
ncbi:facilitated trehalose transporter Tret1-like [Anticarsia gemmatalis]|uniref:facilitated trehalose transporter Tret1-like n=1 Tax=Anticarsia gemmatalis TaxID=129554 RepID=UPI003F75BCC1